ncbi:hypothetical protein [Nonomuraea sp. NPDC050643]|uniref:hypothetical protein n=1 Tax=Nonomuraea sp. NPDC050643 TaxID=3155660 RepID=UPI0033F6FF4A
MTALLTHNRADELTYWDELRWDDRQANIAAFWSVLDPRVARARFTVVETLLAVVDIELGEMQDGIDRLLAEQDPRYAEAQR